LRERLSQNRLSHPLFDSARLTRHIEAAYTTMTEMRERGEPAKSFNVEAIAR
jgi:predicted O-linked N-acetylglucosamine transferase (SPINDLY family)